MSLQLAELLLSAASRMHGKALRVLSNATAQGDVVHAC